MAEKKYTKEQTKENMKLLLDNLVRTFKHIKFESKTLEKIIAKTDENKPLFELVTREEDNNFQVWFNVDEHIDINNKDVKEMIADIHTIAYAIDLKLRYIPWLR